MKPNCDAVELLRSLIAIPSVSGEEKAAADRLFDYLSEREAAPQRSGDSIWFDRTGPVQGRTLLLAAHIDTVAPGDGWSMDPFGAVEREGRLYGLGEVDDKASAAAFTICGLEVRPPAGRLIVALTSGEETGKSGLIELLDLIGPVDAAVIGEPSSLDICIRQRGLLVITAVARGRAGHAGRPEDTVNAIEVAASDILALSKIDPGSADPFLGASKSAATVISGGSAHNVIPDRCEFTIDIRTVPGRSHDEWVRCLKEALCSEIHPHSGRYRPCSTDESEEIVRRAVQANFRAELIGSPTASDWAFLDVPTVKMGPGNPLLSHRPDEYIEVGQVTRAVDVFKRLAIHYLGG